MVLSAGRRLGPYEIVSPLGAGGMGEVYVARDSRLNRRVAIKVLAPGLATDHGHLTRFAREAKAASALNHPNIVAVYDVGESDSGSYVAMELIEGKTLSELIVPGPLSIKKVLDIAIQIADGLAAAHESGIVHRDLKPANIMVTPDGFAKILDFGLARAPAADGPETAAETQTAPPTLTGEIVGTAGYMSPEQARGEPVGFPTDQFSFGSVLYEMATGKRAFRGNTRIDTLAAVLNNEPEPIAKLRPGVPAPLRWVVERCHAKSASDRYRSTRDLAREVRGIREHLSEVSDSAPLEEAIPSRRKFLLAAGAAAAALGVVLWAVLGGSRRTVSGPEFRRLTFRTGVVTRGLFMQRSNSILYTASWDGGSARTYLTLPESKGADRSLEAETQLPMAFSEDGSEVLVLLGRSRAAINSFGTLAWWPALGGKARPYLDNGGWADWARKGRFLAVVQDEGANRTLQIRDSAGKVQKTIFHTAGGISYVAISPDEKRVAFIHHPSRTDDAGEIRVVSVDGTGERALTPVFERCVGMRWNPRSGNIWFTASRSDIYSTNLWAVDLAGKVRQVHPFTDFFVLQDIGDDGFLFVASSEDTRLVLRRGNEALRDFSWQGSTFATDISPDGKSILFLDGSPAAGTLGAWIRPIDGGDAVRLADCDPGKFSPDGAWIVATSRIRSGPPQVILVPVAGGKTRAVTSSPKASYADPSFAGPERLLAVRSEGARRGIWRMRLDGTEAEDLDVSSCSGPVANPAADRFLCLAEPDRGGLVVHRISGHDQGRVLFSLPEGDRFFSARWSSNGDRVFAFTEGGRFLTLDAAAGKLLADTPSLPREGIAAEALLGAVCSPDGNTQAYSISTSSSRLVLGRGLS